MRSSAPAVFAWLCLLSASPAFAQLAQPNIETVGEPWTGERAVIQSVAEISARQALVDMQGRRIRPPRVRKIYEEFHPIKRADPKARKTSRWPLASTLAAPAAAPSLEPLAPQEVGANFAAVSFFDGGNAVPPDSMGSVGLTQVMVLTNGRMKVFDKQGNLGPLDVDLDTFFSSLVGPGQFVSDPHVRYDRLSGRWFITAITATGADREPANNILIAVSSGAIIDGASSFSLFRFRHDQAGIQQPNIDSGGFADYDTLGVDKFALYMGVNVFKFTGAILNIRSTGYVIRKADLLNGTLTVTPFRELGIFTLNSDNTFSGSGMDTPQGVDNDDPNASEGYFIGVDMTSFSILNLRRVSNPGSTPGMSPNIVLSVPTTAFPLDQVQPSVLTLDAVSDRLFAAAIHTNRITGVKSLWTAHNIAVDATGVGSETGDRNGSRWYELRDLTAANPTLFQAGTVFDSSTDPTTPRRGFWMPSVAMSGQGHMALGASFASTGDRPGVAVAGRLAVDVLGTTRLPTLAVPGEETYTDGLGEPPQRWGDYSQTAVDPTDAQTMWTFQEYSNFAGLWTVRAIQLKAPRPQITSVSPSSVGTGLSATNVTVTGTGFFDPGPDPGGPGFPNHIAGTVEGIAVTNTTINSPNTVTLTVSTVCSQPGPHTLSIINPDGQAATGLLTVTNFATTVMLTATSASSFINQSVTFTATVTSSAPGSPPGTVTFKDGSTVLANPALVSGQASFTTSSLALGSHTISAEYAGNCDFSASGSTLLHTVNLFGSRTSLVSSLNPSLTGNSVTLTATVVSAPASGGTPAGNVTFKDGTTTLGTLALNASGQASITTSALAVGSHFITATYDGDTLHHTSSSAVLHQLVQAPGIGLAIANSPDPVTIGKTVTITTTITNTGAGAATYTFTQAIAGRFQLISASSSSSPGCSGTGTVTCSLGSGSSASINTVVRVLLGHTLTVTATVTSGTASGSLTDPVRVRFRPFKF